MSNRKDLLAYIGSEYTQTWYINQSINGVDTPYDMTGKEIKMLLYDKAGQLLFTKDPLVNPTLGNVTFRITPQEANLEAYDYYIREAPVGANLLLIYGRITFINANFYIPTIDLVRNETPTGVIISDSYIAIKIHEWRLFLQNAIDPHISDEDVHNETVWPMLVNLLIAKLVVYDAILKALKGLIGQTGSSGTTTENGTGNVKMIQTGPTTVEFFNAIGSLSTFSKTDSSGTSPLKEYAVDICQLAQRLKIYLPICKNMNRDPFIPLKAERPNPTPLDFNSVNYG